MHTKPVLLLSGAHTLPFVCRDSVYDEKSRMMNAIVDEKMVPLVEVSPAAVTGSKTAQARGDDDPDPQDERCY